MPTFSVRCGRCRSGASGDVETIDGWMRSHVEERCEEVAADPAERIGTAFEPGRWDYSRPDIVAAKVGTRDPDNNSRSMQVLACTEGCNMQWIGYLPVGPCSDEIAKVMRPHFRVVHGKELPA